MSSHGESSTQSHLVFFMHWWMSSEYFWPEREKYNWSFFDKYTTMLFSKKRECYCAFHKHANSKVQKPPSQLRFSLPPIIITITSNEPWNTETHKTDRNSPITNDNPWTFETIKVKFCFLRGPLRWLTVAKNAIVSWLLNFCQNSHVCEKRSISLWKSSLTPD